MPRYYFHFPGEAPVVDEDGIELADAEAAHLAAVAGIRSLMCDQLRDGRLDLTQTLEVRDSAGEAVLTIAFAEAIRIRY